MGLSQLTGTPWHYEKMVRAEGDPRRYRGRCFYFRKSDTYCLCHNRKCFGSAHCDQYTEDEPPTQKSQTVDNTKKKKEYSRPKETNIIALSKSILPIGSVVKHKKYGEGRVIRYDAECVVINFFDIGNRTMDIKSSINQLRKIDRFNPS